MKRVFTVMLIATACVVGSTPGFARGGVVHLLARPGVGLAAAAEFGKVPHLRRSRSCFTRLRGDLS